MEGGQRFQESEVLSPGDQVTVFDTQFGKIGLCICFDFRFQELAKAMADRGAQLIVVPAAFNMTTGPAHWELLFCQRAVDNQVFTLGTAPARNEAEERAMAEIDFARNQSIRCQLPICAARREELYGFGRMPE